MLCVKLSEMWMIMSAASDGHLLAALTRATSIIRAVRVRKAGALLLMLSLVGLFTAARFYLIPTRVEKYTDRHLNTSPSKNRLFVIFEGRLGNHMFQYASLTGIASHNNMTAIVPENTRLWDVFHIVGKKGDQRMLYNPVVLNRPRAGVYYERFLNLSSDCLVLSYLQSYKYFEGIRAELKTKHFAFKESLRHAARRYIDDARRDLGKPGSIVVGMHVRRGDFVRQIKKGYGVATRPYLYRAMNYFTNKYKQVVFLIASNDIYWCKDNVRGPYDIHYSHNADAAMDLAILASCDHIIITTGSFSWWAGYLNNGETVYYRDYPINGTWLATLYQKQDYYPPWWKPM